MTLALTPGSHSLATLPPRGHPPMRGEGGLL